MAATSYQSVLQLAASLSREEQLRLIEELELMAHPAQKTSVLALYGLGAEIWQDMDAQEYVTRERSSWAG